MTEKQATTRSKFLSLVLRHNPETIGLQLDEQGWADVDELLRLMAAHAQQLSRDELNELVRTNAKQRFAFSSDCSKIRASQGHSIDIELGLSPTQPPEYLYHGTVAAALPAIREQGLQKMSRQHIHLSKDIGTAEIVARRRGKPIILTVKSGDMHRDGAHFFLSANGVWLTDEVAPRYIDFDTQQGVA